MVQKYKTNIKPSGKEEHPSVKCRLAKSFGCIWLHKAERLYREKQKCAFS